MFCFQVDELQYKLAQQDVEKRTLVDEASRLRDHIDTLQVDCDRWVIPWKSVYGRKCLGVFCILSVKPLNFIVSRIIYL